MWVWQKSKLRAREVTVRHLAVRNLAAAGPGPRVDAGGGFHGRKNAYSTPNFTHIRCLTLAGHLLWWKVIGCPPGSSFGAAGRS